MKNPNWPSDSTKKFTKIYNKVQVDDKTPQHFRILEALSKYPRLLKRFTLINAISLKCKYAIALGHLTIPKCHSDSCENYCRPSLPSKPQNFVAVPVVLFILLQEKR